MNSNIKDQRRQTIIRKIHKMLLQDRILKMKEIHILQLEQKVPITVGILEMVTIVLLDLIISSILKMFKKKENKLPNRTVAIIK